MRRALGRGEGGCAGLDIGSTKHNWERIRFQGTRGDSDLKEERDIFV